MANSLARAVAALAAAAALTGCGGYASPYGYEQQTVTESVLGGWRGPSMSEPGLSGGETDQPLYPANPLDYDWRRGRLLDK